MSERLGDGRPEGGHVLDRLSAYIDNSLGKAGQEKVRVHLEGCAECRADYLELLATRQMLRSMPAVVPPRAAEATPTAPVVVAVTGISGEATDSINQSAEVAPASQYAPTPGAVMNQSIAPTPVGPVIGVSTGGAISTTPGDAYLYQNKA